jgi:hypothetical protein
MGISLVVIIVTPVSVPLIVGWVRYRCCVQHCLQALNMCLDLLIILWYMGGDLIDKHP